MSDIVRRLLWDDLAVAMDRMPAVGLLGPRQCGKSTLAHHLLAGRHDVVYLDLERSADLAKLEYPEALFDANQDKLICIDEIQRRPELFPAIRVRVDRLKRSGQFLILGSASRELLRQSSETLAGRIRYLELTPLLSAEVEGKGHSRDYWSRGGFPRSLLAVDAVESFDWRMDFIRDFMERDVPMHAPRIAPRNVRRLWTMLAHLHGQLLNMATLASALGVDAHTVRGYLDLLEGAYMVRRLVPYAANTKKRLVKTPRVYLRDSGILHALLGLEDWNALLGHPVFGTSWEGLCIENILARVRRSVRASFYRTADGAEIDLVLERGMERVAVEFKASEAPRIQRGLRNALVDLGLEKAWVVAPVEDGYALSDIAQVSTLDAWLAAPENRRFLISETDR